MSSNHGTTYLGFNILGVSLATKCSRASWLSCEISRGACKLTRTFVKTLNIYIYIYVNFIPDIAVICNRVQRRDYWYYHKSCIEQIYRTVHVHQFSAPFHMCIIILLQQEQNSDLVAPYSGEKSLYERVAPLLDVMGKVMSIPAVYMAIQLDENSCPFFSHLLFVYFLFTQSKFYLGEVGNGAAMKLVVNMIMGRFGSVSYFISYF